MNQADTSVGVACISCESSNTANHKFCRTCGENLYGSCPECNSQFALNDSFCSSCGRNVSNLLLEGKRDFQKLIRDVEAKVNRQDFGSAIGVLNSFLKADRFLLNSQQLVVEKMLSELHSQSSNLKQQSIDTIDSAKCFLDKHQYSKSLEQLLTIPESIRSDEINELINSAKQKLQQSKGLAEDIKFLIDEKNYLDAFPKIQLLLKLRPNDSKLAKLSSDILGLIRGKFLTLKKQGKYPEAIQLLNRLGNLAELPEFDSQVSELREVVWLTKYAKQCQTLDPVLIRVLEFVSQKTGAAFYPDLIQRAKLTLANAEKKRISNPGWAIKPEGAPTGMEVDFGQPLQRIEGFSDIASGNLNASQYYVAAGLALKGIGNLAIHIDLLKKKQGKGFFGLGNRKTRDRAWGIDFGTDSLKAICLKTVNERIVVDSVETVIYGEATNSGFERETQWRSLLEQLKKNHGLNKDDSIHIAMPGNKMLGRFISLPVADSKTAKIALDYEVKMQVPFPEPEVVWDHHFFESETGKQRAVVVAARKVDVNQLQDLFTSCGLTVASIQAEATALLNVFQNEPSCAGKSFWVLDIGAESSTLSAIAPNFLWFRSIFFGRNDVEKGLAKELNLTRQQSKTRLIDPSTTEEELGQSMISISKAFQSLVSEIKVSSGAFESQMEITSPEKMYCIGGGSNVTGLLTFLRCDTASFAK